MELKIYDYKDLNIDISKQIKHEFYIEDGACYQNIFYILSMLYEKHPGIYEKFIMNDIQICYGYYGYPNEIMTRHCFLYYHGQIIDPTSYDIVDKNKFVYHVFKKLNVNEYSVYFRKYYEDMPKEYAPWFEYMWIEEKEYCGYVIKEKIPVNKFSYDNFLKKYDLEKKVIVIED